MKPLSHAMDAIQVSLGAVYQYEYRLIVQHCHELNIVGAFYHYFRSMFEKRFSTYCIDMEYSRMGMRNVPKEIHGLLGGEHCPFRHEKHGRRVRSDFIIHKPGTDENLLVIEFKGEWSSGCLKWDHRKLCELTKPITSRPAGESYVCGYKLGLSILLKHDGIELQQVRRGKKVGERRFFSREELIAEFKVWMGKKGID